MSGFDFRRTLYTSPLATVACFVCAKRPRPLPPAAVACPYATPYCRPPGRFMPFLASGGPFPRQVILTSHRKLLLPPHASRFKGPRPRPRLSRLPPNRCVPPRATLLLYFLGLRGVIPSPRLSLLLPASTFLPLNFPRGASSAPPLPEGPMLCLSFKWVTPTIHKSCYLLSHASRLLKLANDFQEGPMLIPPQAGVSCRHEPLVWGRKHLLHT